MSTHRHGVHSHAHHHPGPHRHILLPFRSVGATGDEREHRHVHGLVDPSILRSRAGLGAVAASFAVLAVTAVAQAVVFVLSGSVALLADLVHNGGDALTAVPLAIAFLAVSARGERFAGYAVVLTIFVSAGVAAYAAIERLIHPRSLDYLLPLAIAGLIGFAGNEVAARLRLRVGRRIGSAALVADGHHARVDGFVSLGVVVSALAIAVGLTVADPLIGLAITALIARITWQALTTVREADPATRWAEE